ncbi:MAG: Uma2 family endonuclease [Trichodesmium sp. MO_231.B1]|nr:Uma2 family endonuclease [Trichodesmium sp. MO_231.B1]
MEVLSKSTANYDRGEKFKFYRSISDFQEYILIDQYQFYIEQYAKTAEEKWEVISNPVYTLRFIKRVRQKAEGRRVRSIWTN